jgi:hypothetical protein
MVSSSQRAVGIERPPEDERERQPPFRVQRVERERASVTEVGEATEPRLEVGDGESVANILRDRAHVLHLRRLEPHVDPMLGELLYETGRGEASLRQDDGPARSR